MVYLRSILLWLAIIFAETVHGTVRTLLVEPHLDPFLARQISVFTGALVFFAVTLAGIKRVRPVRISECVLIGVLWVAATVSFEILLGRFAMGLSWERMFEDYDLTRGGLLPIGLLLLFLSPLAAAKIRRLV